MRSDRRRILAALGCVAVVLVAGLHGARAQTFDTADWDAVVKAAVHDGQVDYTALKADPRVPAFTARLATFDPATLPSPKARLAFWLNAYNALAISGVLAHFPGLKSVQDPYPDFGFFKRPDFKVGGKTLALNDIENEIVRKRFADPRVHAALNCASNSCPPLRAEAFKAEVLDAQLDDQMRTFVRDAGRNRVDAATGVVALSSIFDWYKGDFAAAGGVAAFVAKYLDAPVAAAVSAAEKGGKLAYLPYDWTLNGH